MSLIFYRNSKDECPEDITNRNRRSSNIEIERTVDRDNNTDIIEVHAFRSLFSGFLISEKALEVFVSFHASWQTVPR